MTGDGDFGSDRAVDRPAEREADTSPGKTPRRRRTVLRTIGASVAGLSGTVTARAGAAQDSDGTTTQEGSTAELVPADGEFGFNYPYFLYTPERSPDEPRPILVEPNNSGGATDDFAPHRELARRLIENYWPRTISDELATPLLVPVFPRPTSDPVDVTHYVHALDTETMHVENGDLARVDLQLRRMVEHAKQRLSERSYAVADRIIMDGFSATGNFVNRFTALHPDIVTSVTAGGVNGTAILPLNEAKGHTLNYQIGVADLEQLVGNGFDRERWTEVDQLIYMGAEDDNDTIPDEDTDVPEERWDAWSAEQREIALDVYGEDMQEDRMPYCESVYEEAGASAEFRLYDGVGHEVTEDILSDLVEFHRSHMDDASMADGTTDSAVEPDDATDSSIGGSVPGFGFAGGLGALGALYLWTRRRDDRRRE